MAADLLAAKYTHDFDMWAVDELVDDGRGLQAVTSVFQGFGITRPRGVVAGNHHDFFDAAFRQLFDLRRRAHARWVDDGGVEFF